jgi:hypothetical protein
VVIKLKPYVVILTAKPAARLPVNTILNLEFKLGNPNEYKKVQISKIEEESAGVKIQTGLSFRMFLNAENVVRAVQSAKSFTDGIASFITVVTGRSMDIPREEIAYELTPNKSEREFLQVFYDIPIKSPSRRQVDPNQLTEFISKLMLMKSPLVERLQRAIRWYRLGAMQNDVYDQFNCFWIGLEALNPILQQKLNVGEEVKKCTKCGNKLVTTKISGIQAFIEQKTEGGSEISKKIRSLRVSIMHSTKTMSEVQELTVTYAPKTAEILFRAILFVSEFEDWSTIKYSTILREFPIRGELRGLLIGGENDALGLNGQDPCMEIHHEILKTTIDEKEKPTYTFKTFFIAQIGTNIQFRQTELLFYGDSESTGQVTDRTLIRKSGETVSL